MKMVLILLFGLLSGTANALECAEKTHVAEWLKSINDGRADKTWTVRLFAAPDVVKNYPALCGIAINSDAALPTATIEIRVPDNERKPRKSPIGVDEPDNGVRARYSGVR